jgi:hypothetical protein
MRKSGGGKIGADDDWQVNKRLSGYGIKYFS